ncbi:uncharacterized protein LOC126902748 [Daktulosphaira vitifoliae]|uniref:uncharacterized protein LOC126902748 n=1 Tax=Daktulosphaira vitifoliae TaxID=58002 RepID=UPI0021A98DB7|nr:uncharacterized protein LOC126902748 [Daktulosphaira vitifoliae]
MIQIIKIVTLLSIYNTCYGTSSNLMRDLNMAWNEWNNHFKGDHWQYVGHYEGMTDDINTHSKITLQYLSGINNVRNWHNVEPLKQIIELDNIAQSYANYIAKTGSFEVSNFNKVFGLLKSCRDVDEDVGKRVPIELYSNFDKGDKPFDFYANEKEMVINENVEGRDKSISMIWKSAINIGIGVAKTNEIIYNKNKHHGLYYIIVAVIYPEPRELGKYKENITPRNLELMIHDGYFQYLQKEKKRNNRFIAYEMDPWLRNLMGSVLENDVSIEKKEN